MHNPLSPKTSYNPLFRHSEQLTSFDASNFVLQDEKCKRLEKKRTYLRRYNSHESSYSFDIIKSDSHDNTPDSTKSRVGSIEESHSSSADRRNDKEFSARDFLERYSLPRVVKIDGGEPLLLYRSFDSFTKIQAKAVFFKKGKEKIDENLLHFPEGYSGWFSLLNEKGEKHAVAHSSILHLVREQVCSFLAVQPFSAYATQSTDPADVDGKLAYFKTQVPGGQLFQLRAVFQHQERSDGSRKSSTRSSRISRSSRDKDLANRYAQLVSQTNQELYVPLTTKGEFYETHTSLKSRLCFPGMLDKTGPLALDKDCLYKISHLLRRVPLPVKVKLLHGSLPDGIPKDFTDTFCLEKKFREPLLVTCTLPPPWSDTPHKISCYNMNSKIKIAKFTFGFDSENRLFKSQRVQSALAFCHKNVETWYKDVKLVPNVEEKYEEEVDVRTRKLEEEICADCKKTRQQCDETECTAKIENITNSENKQIITKEVMNKFPKPKKWYQHFKLLNTNNEEGFEELKDPMDGIEKRRSIDRYKDMSKLIEEKLGRKGYNPVKKSASFMFSTKRIDCEAAQKNSNNPALLKCQSLDSQLYPLAEETNEKCGTSKSNKSDNLSYEFQMCILDSSTSSGERKGKQEVNIIRKNQFSNDIKRINIENRVSGGLEGGKLKKTKPDLIPTLPKEDIVPNSFITERLCAEFHVKTKVQKKASNKLETGIGITKYQVHPKKIPSNPPQKEEYKVSRVLLNVDDIPYSHVADEVCSSPSGKMENIYAEICETDTQMCNKCDNRNCECMRTKSTQYCYVKLGSNGDSVTQSDSDDAIYNTLR